LIRIVRTPEGTIELDPRGKRSGRGAYLCRSWLCWEAALQRGRLSQALKCQVSAEEVASLKALASSLIEEAAVETQTGLAGRADAEGQAEQAMSEVAA
jgi:predicted RNA-binding protein YlxR (DUF448 family)